MLRAGPPSARSESAPASVSGPCSGVLATATSDKNSTTHVADGTEIIVSVDSGMVGELTRAQLRRTDGSWVDLEERPAPA